MTYNETLMRAQSLMHEVEAKRRIATDEKEKQHLHNATVLLNDAIDILKKAQFLNYKGKDHEQQ